MCCGDAPYRIRVRAATFQHQRAVDDEAAVILCELYSRILQDAPDDVDTRLQLAQLHAELARPAVAIEQLDIVLLTSSDNVLARELRGRCYLNAARYKDAHDDFNELLPQLTDGDIRWSCLLHRGIALCSLELVQEAVNDFETAQGMAVNEWLSRRHTWYLQWYAMSLYGVGRNEDAIAVATRAIEAHANSPIAMAARGAAAAASNRFEDAIRDLTAALELAPNYMWARELLANCHGWLGQTQAAPAKRFVPKAKRAAKKAAPKEVKVKPLKKSAQRAKPATKNAAKKKAAKRRSEKKKKKARRK